MKNRPTALAAAALALGALAAWRLANVKNAKTNSLPVPDQAAADAANWPSLSVIIPSFNQGAYIERTLRSILGQGYPGALEVIVSDGGSTDGTVEVLRRYPQVQWWSGKDRGFADAVNKGLAAATGEIVALQSSDDFYLQGAFVKAVAALRDDPSLALVTGNDVFVDDACRPTYPIPKPFITLMNPGAMFSRTTALYIPQHCTFARRRAVERVGGLREEVDYCADTDLWYRLLHFGRGLMLPDYLAAYQIHPAQRTRDKADRFIQAHKRVVEDAERDPFYASRFVPTPGMKRDIFLQWEINWSHTAGGEEGVRRSRVLARRALGQSEDWPDYMMQFLTAFAPEPPESASNTAGSPGVEEPSVEKQTVEKRARRLLLKLKQNPRLRVLFGKSRLSGCAPLTGPESINLDWWKKGTVPEKV